MLLTSKLILVNEKLISQRAGYNFHSTQSNKESAMTLFGQAKKAANAAIEKVET